jgi:hypothetical protein
MLNAHLNRRPITRAACLVSAIALLIITLPIAGFGAFAQTRPAALSGSAVDSIGRILPDLSIVLSNSQTREKRETRSDSAGRFEFVALPAGEYLVEAEMPGLVASDRVTLRGGEHLGHDVALQLGSLQETIRLWASEAPEPLPPPPPPPPPAVRCVVPRVIGMTLRRAKSRIRAKHCSLGRVRRARSRRVGRVIAQTPRPGAVRARGTKVKLVIGRR